MLLVSLTIFPINFISFLKKNDDKQQMILGEMFQKSFLLTEMKSPLVSVVYIEIIKLLMKELSQSSLHSSMKILDTLSKNVEEKLDLLLIQSETLRFEPDLGHSILRKKMIRFIIGMKKQSLGLYLKLNTIIPFLILISAMIIKGLNHL
jgi:hypothetical protein